MSVVVIAGARRTYPRRLAASLAQLRSATDVLHVVTYGECPDPEVTGRHLVIPVAPTSRFARGPRPVRLALRVLRLVFSRRATDHFRRSVLSSPEVDALLRQATVLVAVDPPAVEVAWHVIRRHPDLAAVVGAPAALDVINRRQGAPEQG